MFHTLLMMLPDFTDKGAIADDFGKMRIEHRRTVKADTSVDEPHSLRTVWWSSSRLVAFVVLHKFSTNDCGFIL